MFSCVFLIIFVTSVVPIYESSPYCIIDNSTNLSDPPLPTLPLQYQTVIEANLVNQNISMTAYEYFDYPGDRAALSMTRNGQLNMLLFDYKNDELFDVKGLGCKVTDLMLDNNNILFGNITVNGMPHVFTTGGALHFSKAFGEHYKGQTTVRGIQVDHWQSCLHWPQLQSIFTLDYYFSVKSWGDPINYLQIPVRAVATGQKSNNEGPVISFLHYYDYFNFQTSITDPTVFETPKGVVCSRRKKTKPVPQLPRFYHYTQQVISTSNGKNVTMADFYFPPTTGVIWSRDVSLKSHQKTWWSRGHSLDVVGKGVIDIFTDAILVTSQMTYLAPVDHVVKRTTRGMLCDVYSMVRYDLFNFKGKPAIFEYYFMADNVTGFPDDSGASIKHVPVHLDINVPEADYKESIEFWDFDEGHPRLDVFDVMACYSEASKLQFTVRFTGQYRQENHKEILNQARQKIIAAMNVMPIRVQAPKLNYDNSFIYISAMLLDRSPYEAQFSLQSQKAIEKQDDYVFPSTVVSSLSDCARACVDYADFTCNSFDFCQQDSRPCRISKQHISDGKLILVNSTCDHFSRTVTGPPVPELPISAAYKNLASAVYNDRLLFSIDVPFVFNPDIYKADDVSVIFGWLYPQGVPKLNDRFSYHSEITMPFTNNVLNAHIWYDYPYQLVRYDMYPQSIIHDFNSGLSYRTDMSTGECTISAINLGTFDINIPSSKNSDGQMLELKNPLQFFYLSNNFKYAGQKTIRGIICDVYEATQPFVFNNYSQPALFQMYMMRQDWNELSQGSGIPVENQPVRLIISATDSRATMSYDFYDFSNEHPDLTSFNIQPCYHGAGQHFLIKFNQTYHPTLDRYLSDFQKQVQMTLSGSTGATPLRFQNPQITYSPEFTYYIATMLEQAPFLLGFNKLSNKEGVYSMDASYVSVPSVKECAIICQNITSSNAFTCMSFDYCSGTKLCQLSKTRTPDGNMLKQNIACDHYYRTVDSSTQLQPTVEQAFTVLEDQVAHNLFTITIQTREYENVTYPAILIDRNILRYDSDAIGIDTLKHFTRLKKTVVPGFERHPLRGLSVDECAARCLSNIAFECESFQYCADIGVCTLSDTHPADSLASSSYHRMCDIFARQYSESYIEYPGKFMEALPNTAIENISSPDLCAYACNQNLTCNSFEYCLNKKCYLMTEHTLGISQISVASNLTCSHYSRNFLSNFNKSPQKFLNTGRSVTVTNVSSANCAKLCVESTEFSCQTFTYCGDNTTCILMSSIISTTRSEVQTSKSCDLYSGHVFSQQQPLVSLTTKTAKGYSTGAMVGVGAGMLILGIILGAILLHVIRTRKREKDQA